MMWSLGDIFLFRINYIFCHLVLNCLLRARSWKQCEESLHELLVVSFNFLLLYSWVVFDLEVNGKQVRCAWCDINVILFSDKRFLCVQILQPVDRLISLLKKKNKKNKIKKNCKMLAFHAHSLGCCEWCCDLVCRSRPALEAHSDFRSDSLFHVCLCACSRPLEMSLKAGCSLCGRTALSAWILLFLLHFSHLGFLEAVLKESHFLGLHLLPPGLFEMLEKEPFYLFIC